MKKLFLIFFQLKLILCCGERKKKKRGKKMNAETSCAKKNRILKQAREIMDIHGLQSWRLVMDNAKRRLGCCKYNRKIITLSQRHIETSQEVDIIDTVLHEVAHALVGPNNGHNSAWRAMCVKIGAKPKVCKSVSDNFHDDAPFVAECKPCKNKWERYKRPPVNASYRCPRCKTPVFFERR